MRSLFRNLEKTVVFDEIFHEDEPGREDNFLYFLGKCCAEPGFYARKLIPSHDRRLALFEDYFSYLDELAATRVDGCDAFVASVNYNSLGALNSIYHELYAPPKLLDLVRGEKFKIIHLVRQNILAAILSEMLAIKTGVWHLGYLDADKAETKAKVHVDVSVLMRQLYLARAEYLTFKEALENRANVITLRYETLFEPDRHVNETDLSRLETHLHLAQPLPRQVEYAKTTTIPLRDLIENIGEVEAALGWTPFGHMLDA